MPERFLIVGNGRERGNEMKIKICGLTRPEDIVCVNRWGPDCVGFVFWPESRRYVDRQRAAQLKKLLSSRIQAVGVFVDAPVENVTGLLAEGIIDAVQLHGEESEEDIRCIQETTGAMVIKAVKVYSRQDVEAWMDSRADYLLFDSGMGSGRTFDWRLLAGINRPCFLAGGLGADNLGELLDHIIPYGIDVSSSVETDGHKDPEKICQIIEQVRDRSGQMQTVCQMEEKNNE